MSRDCTILQLADMIS